MKYNFKELFRTGAHISSIAAREMYDELIMKRVCKLIIEYGATIRRLDSIERLNPANKLFI